jgi:transposase InsO family protein
VASASPPRSVFHQEGARVAIVGRDYARLREAAEAWEKASPDSAWVVQCGRQLTDPVDGCLRGKRFLLHDRDPRFSDAFGDTLAAAGVEIVRLPPRSPNLNAYAERFVRTIKESCLDRLILVGERSLRRAIHEFVEHYHHERNHQGVSNRLLFPAATAHTNESIACRPRLGGLLKYYHRPAA